MRDGAQELTREELYRLVWETPMSRLAEQFGISGNGLAKICRRIDVPYPPRGWWAKKAAGKALKVDPLPKAKAETPSKVTISATPEESSGLKAAIRQKQAEIPEISVPQRLTSPHPIIAAWREHRQRRIEEARRERDPWRRSLYAVTDFTPADRRLHRVLHALFHVLEKYGAVISETDRKQLVATIEGEKIEFSLTEKSRQVTRPLTAEEKRWESWNKTGLRTELEPTGYFQCAIKAWVGEPFRKNWLERERRPIDGMLPEIAGTLLALGPFLAERTRIREEKAQELAERQKARELAQQRQQQDENRWRRFLELAEQSRSTASARAFIAELRKLDLPAGDPIDGKSLSDWLDWAEARATSSDPLEHGLTRIFNEIAEVKSWTYPR